jgi:xanthine dehydrogenase YagR molybdenum-binding subunit
MKFDAPAGRNVIDTGRVVGHPVDRVEGPQKVSGAARYAYEYPAPNVAYGVVLGAQIAKGRIVAIDTKAAHAAPGVLLVLTHHNTPKQNADGPHAAPQLQGPDIIQREQAIALVVAESFEQARAAARQIAVTYAPEPGRYDLAAELDKAVPAFNAHDCAVGDFDAAFARAPVKLDLAYTTPDQAHAMMEPHASLARWEGDTLTLHTSHQIIHWSLDAVAGTLGLKPENVRIVSAFVGGGFGSKLTTYADAILAALAARQLRRPVKVALTRPQIFNHTTHRPATIQRVRLGAERDGRLTAIAHEAWSGNHPGAMAENAAGQTRLLYASAARLTRTRVTVLDLPKGGAMRAPGEAVGMLALEGAMDELAEKLNIDPVELRIRNDVQYDPRIGPTRPFSSRKLVECLRTGAARFGWDKRDPKPAQTRDGRWLVGMGVAAGVRSNLVTSSGARVRLDRDGVLTIETQQTDIGTGSYTILAQVGAEMLGLPLEKVRVRLGDSAFPRAAGSGGSLGANSSASGLYYACENLRAAIAQRAGFNSSDAVFANGKISAGDRALWLAEAAGEDGVEAEGEVTFGALAKSYAQASFAAHFAEVGVDGDSGETRVRRMLSVCAAGRIINPKTARGQCLGGMAMGIGAALMEECIVDAHAGCFINHDLAEYLVPTHADIPALEVIFLDELDDKSSPIKAKGVGELGISGVGAAVANALYNACGMRIRDFPLTLDKVLAGLDAA